MNSMNGSNRRPRAGFALILAAAVSAGVPVLPALQVAPAFAADAAAAKAVVDAAKARGEVGEQGDGYLGIVDPAKVSPEARSAVAVINAGRADAYRDIAAKSGVTAEAAGQAAARQLLERLPSGQYSKPLGGGWVRK
jgi:uncharacterized protein YdbL (DUF1318 family)